MPKPKGFYKPRSKLNVGQHDHVRLGRRSQRKGRRAESEVRDILKAAGYDAVVKGMYETGDLLWGLCGRDRTCEVKRPKDGLRKIYEALGSNHALFIRTDNRQWLIIQTLDQYIHDNTPQAPPQDAPAIDMEDYLAALE